MRLTLSFFCLFFTYPTLAFQDIDYYVIERVAEPFQIYNQGKHSGIISEVVDKVIGLNNLKVKTYPFVRMEVDMSNSSRSWINYGTKSWANIQSKNLSETSLLDVEHVFLTTKGFKYESIESLFGKRIVLVRGFKYPGLNKYLKEKIDVVYVDSFYSVFKALEVGRAVAFPGMTKRILYHLKKSEVNVEKFSFHDISSTISNYSIYLSYSLNFPKKLKGEIDTKLKSLKSSGALADIISGYVANK